ncbi:MAG: NAD-dependent epimerase/dehydratase family protein [Deltaproteobacteria bacterium]|nr:NAD-dependent epimerase/dehydratase family protein [Deltaproteobacteria bacterium]
MITLVTGATGTVGAAVTDELLAAGRRVRALVRDVDRARKLLPAAVELVPGDITDAASVAAAVKGCGAVFHTAGLPEQWLKDPSRFVAVNVEGSKHVGEAALAAGVASFVYTSTIDVFAWQHDTAFDETQLATSPKGSHYERSKQEADRAMVALQERGLPVRYTHPSAVYGPAPVCNPGLNDVLVRLVRGKLPMLLPGGIPVVYAPDVARGHLAAESAPVGARFILSDRFVTLVELARETIVAAGRGKVPRVMPIWMARIVSGAGEGLAKVTRSAPLIPAGQLQFLLESVHPSAERAGRELGWKATPLATGLARTMTAFSERGFL